MWVDQPRVVGAGRPLLADGPGWRPAALWLSRDNLSLGGTLLSCATLYPGVGHAAPSPGEQDDDARGSLRLIAADQAARHPGRNAVTVSALMVGLSIMIGVAVMVRSFS